MTDSPPPKYASTPVAAEGTTTTSPNTSLSTPPLSSKLRSTAPPYHPRHSPLSLSTPPRPSFGCTPPLDIWVDFILVIDFEATCDEPQPVDYTPEIVEFPVVVIDVGKRCVVAEFHRYVRPIDKPVLSAFCKSLTGISQDEITAASDLQTVVNEFDAWLATVVPVGKTFIFATDGPWDLRDFMYTHAVQFYNVRFPDYFYRWVDVKETFAEFFACRRGKIAAMLDYFGMAFEGRLHSGIDDARNIAKIVLALLDAGCPFSTMDELEKSPPRAHLRRHRQQQQQQQNRNGSSALQWQNTASSNRFGFAPPFALPPPGTPSSSPNAKHRARVAEHHQWSRFS